MAKRASFQLDPGKTILIATGNVAVVTRWIEGAAPGSVRPQETDEHGVPLWVVDALDESDPEADRASVVGIRIASVMEPKVEKYRPLAFEALSVSCYVRKADGALVSMFNGALKSAAAAKAAA